MEPYKIGVVGAAGRMGSMLLSAIADSEDCIIAGGTEPPGSPAVGRDLGALIGAEPIGLAVTEDPVGLFATAQAVIDFTSPKATVAHAELAAQGKTVHVIGTTGLNGEQEAALARAGRHTPVVYAPNMSLGVNLLMSLVERVARALGEDYDIEVLEMHHRYKVDAPSGTALGLGKAAARGRGLDLEEVAQRVRDGHTGARKRGDIGFATLRGGDVVGDHKVIFAAEGERVELGHIASNREIYARGALHAARWARDRAPGLYSMNDVLGLTG